MNLTANEPGNPSVRTASVADVSGRDRMVRNVVSSWLGQFVFIVAGLIMPRLIDRSLGQEMLGIWDFAWSVVGYFSILQVGIVSSVSRYVAKYQAVEDDLNTNRAVSSASAMLITASAIMVMVTVAIYFALPGMKAASALGAHLDQARLVVLILGLEIAFQSAFSAFGGVLTGHHRWQAHYGIQAIGYVVSVVGMVTALLLGGGLPWVAVAHWIGDGGAWLVRAALAYKVCPQLHISPRYVHWITAKSMLKFGGKVLIPSTAELFLNQTINLLILATPGLGPASLALYARSMTLVRHITTLVAKVSAILSPSTSSLQATGDRAGIRALALDSVRWTALLAFPILTVFIIQGDHILHLWMGSAYRQAFLLAVMSVGFSGLIIQYPVLGMLVGLNRHGRAGLAHLVAGILSVVCALSVLKFTRLGLLGVVSAATIPVFITYLTYIPAYVARSIDVSLWAYFRRGFLFPALCVLPFAAIQLAARWIWHGQPAIALITGMLAGAAALAPIYWNYALPASLQSTVLRRTRLLFGLKPQPTPSS